MPEPCDLLSFREELARVNTCRVTQSKVVRDSTLAVASWARRSSQLPDAKLHDYLLKRVYCPIDVMAGATLYDYGQHTVTWDGKDSKGHVVPDGAYVLWIDAQIDERSPMLPFRIDFTKGRMAQTITPAADPPQTGTTLTYTPNN